MRKVFGIILALAGGYLLWWAFKFVRVLLIVPDKSGDGIGFTIIGVLAAAGLGLLVWGWQLFRKPGWIAPPPALAPPPAVAPPAVAPPAVAPSAVAPSPPAP